MSDTAMGDGTFPLSRLSDATLRATGSARHVALPTYDRSALRTGIVHLGLGAFFRAHGAVYTDDVLARGDRRWGIAGASLRSSATADALAAQDGLYTVLERGETDRLRVVGALTATAGPDGLDALLGGALIAPSLGVISLTVTEKAYGRDGATGGLDDTRADIAADLRAARAGGGTPPRTVVGVLAEALRRRSANRLPAVAVMSCDNLPSNGAVLARMVSDYATLAWGSDVARRIADAALFPSTVVDRITPATTDADRAAVDAIAGWHDAWPVVAEPFSQWVIEDRFPDGRRPAWEREGALLVTDVAPFEHMKLRMLNGAHTALACLGQVAGLDTIGDVMAEPVLAAFADALMRDAADTLPRDPQLDPDGYRAALLARFRNRRLPHRTAQIASDTSQKLPGRILAAIASRTAAGRTSGPHALAVAAWMRLLGGDAETGAPIPIDDGPAEALRSAAALPDARDAAAAVLGSRDLFGAIGADPRVVDAVAGALDRLRRDGVRAACAGAVSGSER